MTRITLLAACAALGLAGCGEEPKSLTVVSWGGAYEKAQRNAHTIPFAERTETTVNVVAYNGGIAEVKAQVESKNVTWDVVSFELADGLRACDEGLLERIDPASLPAGANGTPADRDFVPLGVTDCIVATDLFAHVIAYDTTRLTGAVPQGPADFFDLATFPGKRGLRKSSPKVNLELALLADGVAPKDVYAALATPEGVARAFAKLDTIKAETVWWETGAQPPQLLADGEVVMTTAYNGRIFNAQTAEKKPFAIVWNGHLQDLEGWGIVRGTPRKETALAFVKFSTATEQLAAQARWIPYGPARNSSLALVGNHAELGIPMLAHLPNAPQNSASALVLDHVWWADRQDALQERWSAWLAQ